MPPNRVNLSTPLHQDEVVTPPAMYWRILQAYGWTRRGYWWLWRFIGSLSGCHSSEPPTPRCWGLHHFQQPAKIQQEKGSTKQERRQLHQQEAGHPSRNPTHEQDDTTSSGPSNFSSINTSASTAISTTPGWFSPAMRTIRWFSGMTAAMSRV